MVVYVLVINNLWTKVRIISWAPNITIIIYVLAYNNKTNA